MQRNSMRAAALAALVMLAAGCGGADDDADAMDADTLSAAPAPAPTAAAPADGALLDPDAATQEQLAAIPGIDATMATRIIEARPYADMLDVDRLLSEQLDEAQREEVYRHLWKPIDLNNASGEEILLIPGVGPRMQHEFEEYRPYTAIEQFRREMGKYVDDAEVARLEKYVAIR